MQLGPSTSQGLGIIPYQQHQQHQQHQLHHAPPPRPPALGPPVKVNLRSNCLECQVKLKKKLQKMDGVTDVEIIPEQGGIVTVSGSIDPKVLMEVIRKYYKKAELICPFDKKESFCSKTHQNKKVSCSDDEHDDDSKEDDHHKVASKEDERHKGSGKEDDHHKVAAKNSSDNDAGVMSEPKDEKKEKKKKMWGIMRCFGKESSPSKPLPPPLPPPQPAQSQTPGHRPPFMGLPGYGYFPGPPRPGFRPPGMLPWMPPPGAPPPYGGYSGRPPLMLPMGSGYYPSLRSPPRSNPMVHYTNYMDNYRYYP